MGIDDALVGKRIAAWRVEALVALLIDRADAALHATQRQFAEIEMHARAPGLCRTACAIARNRIEDEAAIGGTDDGEGIALRLRPFELEVAFFAETPGCIRRNQRLIGGAGILLKAGDAEAPGIHQPGFRPPAIAVAVHLVEGRRIFVGGNDELLIGCQARRQYRRCASRRRGQRLGEDQHALHVVDGIALALAQQLAVDYQPGASIANLDGNLLRALIDVGTLEEIDRTAGALELVALGQRAGLGGKRLQPGNRIAIDGGGFRFEIGLRAVKSALVTGQFDALDTGLEIAPHHMAAAAIDPHIELAGGRCILLDQRVVAIDRVIVVGIEPPQELARILLVHVGKQRIEVFLVGIECRRDDIAALHLAL